MWIEREISALIQREAAARPAVLLTGARQTGKSSLLDRLFPEHPYVSLDVPLEAKQAAENGNDFLDSHGTPLIIDEIQYAPELFRQIKVRIDRRRQENGQYLMTGSQKFSLMQGVSESLSGRVSILDLHTLSIRELANHFQHALTPAQVLEWLVMGGYPEVYRQKLEPYRFFSSYVATYIERDVRQLINIRQVRAFDQFMRLLAIRSGQVFSMSRIAAEVGVSANTIKSWIGVLEASGVIYLLRPYYRNFGKRIVKSPKLYFLDTGLLCYLTNIQAPETLRNSPLLGAYFETLAFGQLLRNLHNQGKADEIYYFRDREGHEVDFLIPEGDKLHLYECKWSDDSGSIPKNIKKIIPSIGEENIRQITTLTTTPKKIRLSKQFSVSNLAEL